MSNGVKVFKITIAGLWLKPKLDLVIEGLKQFCKKYDLEIEEGK